MNIVEAVKKAKHQGKYMRRTKKDGWEWIRIQPTNGPDYCIIHSPNMPELQKACRMWNPSAEDLEADDWEVVDFR